MLFLQTNNTNILILHNNCLPDCYDMPFDFQFVFHCLIESNTQQFNFNLQVNSKDIWRKIFEISSTKSDELY